MFRRRSSGVDDHERILWEIGALLRLASADEALEDGELANRLAGAGVDPKRAWRLVTFVPIAFGRVVLPEFGVETQPTYLIRRDDGTDLRRRLRDEPEYRAAADHVVDFRSLPGFKELASRSAEVNALSNLLNAGSEGKDAVMTEILTYER